MIDYPEGTGPPDRSWLGGPDPDGRFETKAIVPRLLPVVADGTFPCTVTWPFEATAEVTVRPATEDDEPCGERHHPAFLDCVLPLGHDCPHLGQTKEHRYDNGPLFVESIRFSRRIT